MAAWDAFAPVSLSQSLAMDSWLNYQYGGFRHRSVFSPPFPVSKGSSGLHHVSSFPSLVLSEAYELPPQSTLSKSGRRQIPLDVSGLSDNARAAALLQADQKQKRRDARKAAAKHPSDVWSQDTLSEDDDGAPAETFATSTAVPKGSGRADTRSRPVSDALAAALDPSLASFDRALQADSALRVIPVAGDGDCFYRATALQVFGDAEQCRRVRDAVVSYMRGEIESAEGDADDSTVGRAAARRANSTRAYFQELVWASEGPHVSLDAYTQRMSMQGSWAGYIEMLAAEELYDRPVRVWYVPPAGTDYSSLTSALQGQGIHFKGELPSSDSSLPVEQAPLAGVTPLRYAYSRGNHFDAIVSVHDLCVVKEYSRVEAAWEDYSWDTHAVGTAEEQEEEQGMMVLYQLPSMPRGEWMPPACASKDEEDEDEAEEWDVVMDTPPPLASSWRPTLSPHAQPATGHSSTKPWIRYRIRPPCPPRRASRVIRASRRKRLEG